MMKKLLTAFLGLTLSLGAAFGQGNSGELRGVVKDAAGSPLPFAQVTVNTGGQLITGAVADIDGNYSIKPINVGTYDIITKAIGLPDKKITGVTIQGSRTVILDILMENGGVILKDFIYVAPTISKDQTVQDQTFNRKDLLKLPSRDAISAAKLAGGANGREGELSLRGSRGGALVFIDGVKVRGGSGIPQQAIQEVQVILGGVPATMGDATGGIINLQTKGVSNLWFGSVEGRTSQFLDAYGNHLFQATVGGPLIGKKVRGENGQFKKDTLRVSMKKIQ